MKWANFGFVYLSPASALSPSLFKPLSSRLCVPLWCHVSRLLRAAFDTFPYAPHPLEETVLFNISHAHLSLQASDGSFVSVSLPLLPTVLFAALLKYSDQGWKSWIWGVDSLVAITF